MPMPAPEPGQQWGILGGAFDPIHYGHLTLAEEIQAAAQLEGVLFVTSYNPPRKVDGCIASFDDRMEMLRLAIADNERFALSDIESATDQTGYSLHVVRALKRRYPGVVFSFIIGADLLKEIETWHEAFDLMREVSFIAGSRPHSELRVPTVFPSGSFRIMPTQLVNLASHEIRERIAAGITLNELAELTPRPVAEFILKRGLYA